MAPKKVEKHCELPATLPEVCTPELHAVLERNIARDWDLFYAGYYAYRGGPLLDTPEKTGALCPQCGFETVTSSVTMEAFDDICYERDVAQDDANTERERLKFAESELRLTSARLSSLEADHDALEAEVLALREQQGW